MERWQPMVAELQSERLRLGPWRDDDLDDYAALVGERDRRSAAASRNGRPALGELRNTIRRQQSALVDTGIALLVIRRDAAFVGYCGLTQGRATLAEPELAYELLRSFQGKGYATEAARAVVDAAAATGAPAAVGDSAALEPGIAASARQDRVRADKPRDPGRLRRAALARPSTVTDLQRGR